MMQQVLLSGFEVYNGDIVSRQRRIERKAKDFGYMASDFIFK